MPTRPDAANDAATLARLNDEVDALVQALRQCDAAAKVRAALAHLREARESGQDVLGAVERLQAQVDAMIATETLYLLRETLLELRRHCG